MPLRPEEIRDILRREIENYQAEADVYEAGTVVRVGDGIAYVYGLTNAMSNELLEFKGGLMGMALNLEEDSVGCVLLGPYFGIREGDKVRRTGRIVEVPVGEDLLGRVVDPLGRPLDGGADIKAAGFRPIENPAPGVIRRQPVETPLQTGIKSIDALVPIGRGQRELIIGDRKTRKTAIAVDSIINQKGQDVICIYVAVGQKASTVASVVQELRRAGALDYSIVVSAPASEPASMLYIAPYAGAAMAEYFMYSGKDVLIIYDDLSKHAAAYRELSLLLHRPPGREAYPGDVFYLHSRLLERAAKLSKEEGGGSMTALPIIETQAGDISAYIPTNVISITDGQIFLESDLFHSGFRPAINVGLSVSRVGGKAQIKAMKQVAGSLRLDLAQYRELAVFAQFGTDLDPVTQATLDKGARITEALKQPQYSPLPVEEQVLTLYFFTHDYAKAVPVREIVAMEGRLLDYFRHFHSDILREIREKKALSEELIARIEQASEEFLAMEQRSDVQEDEDRAAAAVDIGSSFASPEDNEAEAEADKDADKAADAAAAKEE